MYAFYVARKCVCICTKLCVPLLITRSIAGFYAAQSVSSVLFRDTAMQFGLTMDEVVERMNRNENQNLGFSFILPFLQKKGIEFAFEINDFLKIKIKTCRYRIHFL